MIVLLNCSISLSASECSSSSSTGDCDSVLIAYDDLRIVNSKLIELKYEKEINEKLRQVVRNDSSILNTYSINNTVLIQKNKKVTRQRNICFGVAVSFIIVSLFSFLK